MENELEECMTVAGNQVVFPIHRFHFYYFFNLIFSLIEKYMIR